MSSRRPESRRSETNESISLTCQLGRRHRRPLAALRGRRRDKVRLYRHEERLSYISAKLHGAETSEFTLDAEPPTLALGVVSFAIKANQERQNSKRQTCCLKRSKSEKREMWLEGGMVVNAARLFSLLPFRCQRASSPSSTI